MAVFQIKQPSSRPGAAQNVTFAAAGGASATSTAFGAGTFQIRISVSGTGFVAGTGGVRYRVVEAAGGTAVAADTFLPTGVVEHITVTPGQKIAVLGNDAGVGTLSVTEMS